MASTAREPGGPGDAGGEREKGLGRNLEGARGREADHQGAEGLRAGLPEPGYPLLSWATEITSMAEPDCSLQFAVLPLERDCSLQFVVLPLELGHRDY